MCDKLLSVDKDENLCFDMRFWGESKTSVCWGEEKMLPGGCSWCVWNTTDWTTNIQIWYCTAEASLWGWGGDSLAHLVVVCCFLENWESTEPKKKQWLPLFLYKLKEMYRVAIVSGPAFIFISKHWRDKILSELRKYWVKGTSKFQVHSDGAKVPFYYSLWNNI